MSKPILKKIDGILLLDKPLFITSNGALQRVKRLFGAKKAGHTGSLDPLATGMLPICFGEATKFSQFLLESDKCYQVEAKLGIKTRTGDAEGEVIATKPVVDLTHEKIEMVLRQFEGSIQQIPPMYSALKVEGRPLYELARKGIEISREARSVHIYRLQLIDFQSDILKLEVQCSKGTYVRTLIEDIG
jgi:tRNA pseudouridine55 synthase